MTVKYTARNRKPLATHLEFTRNATNSAKNPFATNKFNLEHDYYADLELSDVKHKHELSRSQIKEACMN